MDPSVWSIWPINLCLSYNKLAFTAQCFCNCLNGLGFVWLLCKIFAAFHTDSLVRDAPTSTVHMYYRLNSACDARFGSVLSFACCMCEGVVSVYIRDIRLVLCSSTPQAKGVGPSATNCKSLHSGGIYTGGHTGRWRLLLPTGLCFDLSRARLFVF